MTRQEIYGYLMIISGILLVGYTQGWFNFMNIFFVLGGAALIIYGARKAGLFDTAKTLIDKVQK